MTYDDWKLQAPPTYEVFYICPACQEQTMYDDGSCPCGHEEEPE